MWVATGMPRSRPTSITAATASHGILRPVPRLSSTRSLSQSTPMSATAAASARALAASLVGPPMTGPAASKRARPSPGACASRTAITVSSSPRLFTVVTP
jgi:hypothetical protein